MTTSSTRRVPPSSSSTRRGEVRSRDEIGGELSTYVESVAAAVGATESARVTVDQWATAADSASERLETLEQSLVSIEETIVSADEDTAGLLREDRRMITAGISDAVLMAPGWRVVNDSGDPVQAAEGCIEWVQKRWPNSPELVAEHRRFYEGLIDAWKTGGCEQALEFLTEHRDRQLAEQGYDTPRFD